PERNRPLCRLQLQPQLFTHRIPERRISIRRRVAFPHLDRPPHELECIDTSHSRAVDNIRASILLQLLEENIEWAPFRVELPTFVGDMHTAGADGLPNVTLHRRHQLRCSGGGDQLISVTHPRLWTNLQMKALREHYLKHVVLFGQGVTVAQLL